VRLLTSLPEQAHDLDRFLEHRESLVGRRPDFPDDVLVQVFARAYAEKKPALHQHRGSGRGVGDDRRVDADQRARDARSQPKARGRL
jgi:hypothetical protein